MKWCEKHPGVGAGKNENCPICVKENKAISFKFEQIDDSHQRAKVLGGWLVKSFENVYHAENNYSDNLFIHFKSRLLYFLVLVHHLLPKPKN